MVRLLIDIAAPTGVRSSSMALSLREPSREPVREYGRGVVATVERVDVEDLKEVLLLAGVRPGRLPFVLALSVRAGVGARLGGCLLSGDSGRGSDGRLGLKFGLEGRTPGPTV